MDRDHYSDKDCFLLGIGWDYRMKGEDTQRYQLKDECILDNLIIQDVAVLVMDEYVFQPSGMLWGGGANSPHYSSVLFD